MTNPSVLQADTILYSPAEPKGRMFPRGESWPGDAWSADRGGEPVGKGATAQAMKDLIAAQDTIDALTAQMAAKDHDLAGMAAQRDEATGKVADLEQEAIAAKAAQTAAEEAARGYMLERDQARENEQTAKAATEKTQKDLDAANATVTRITGELETANQTIASLPKAADPKSKT